MDLLVRQMIDKFQEMQYIASFVSVTAPVDHDTTTSLDVAETMIDFKTIAKPFIRLQTQSFYNCSVFIVFLPEVWTLEDSAKLVDEIFAAFDSKLYNIGSKNIKFQVVQENMNHSFRCIVPKRIGWIMCNDYPIAIYGHLTILLKVHFIDETGSKFHETNKYIEAETNMRIKDLKRILNTQQFLQTTEEAGNMFRYTLCLDDEVRLEDLNISIDELDYFKMSCHVTKRTMT